MTFVPAHAQRNHFRHPRLQQAIAAAGLHVPKPQITWEIIRRKADELAADKGEWGGAPIPVDHVPLVIEPRYPFQGLNGMQFGNRTAPAPKEIEDYTLLNQWFSESRQATVYVCREANGKSRAYLYPSGPGQRVEYWINTLAVAAQQVWTVECESRAIDKLRSLVTTQAMRCYQLSGMFLETSRRSKVTYLFRKLRPTLALRPNRNDKMQVIAGLCLHPIGYYERSWAGVMCPTDDVIAHLLMMRGDEPQFWRKANHHPLGSISIGI